MSDYMISQSVIDQFKQDGAFGGPVRLLIC